MSIKLSRHARLLPNQHKIRLSQCIIPSIERNIALKGVGRSTFDPSKFQFFPLHFHTSKYQYYGIKSLRTDGNEAIIMQQMLDIMEREDEEEENKFVLDKELSAITGPLPLDGVVLEVRNQIATISGLRHATIGSVVKLQALNNDTSDSTNTETIAHGLVLYLEKYSAKVALFEHKIDPATEKPHQIVLGMKAMMGSTELGISIAVSQLKGKVLNSLGKEYVLENEITSKQLEDDKVMEKEELSLQWGSSRVPGVTARARLQEPLSTGINSIDAFQPLAFGHRIGLFGARGSGKTRLMLDIVSNILKLRMKAGNQIDCHIIYVCIGKSKSRIQQVVDVMESRGILEHVTVIAANDTEDLLMQYLAPFTGCAIAERVTKLDPHGNSSARHAIIVYDDLAAHQQIVETLGTSMHLPKPAQLTLSAHNVLVERSAPLAKGRSLTSFILSDVRTEEYENESKWQQHLTSLVDDSISLDIQLSAERYYPPINVLSAGKSIRGPPFQSAQSWKCMSKLRRRINEASEIKEHTKVTQSLGLEMEPEVVDVLEFQVLVKDFFSQATVGTEINDHGMYLEVGLFWLAHVDASTLPYFFPVKEYLNTVVHTLQTDEAYEELHKQVVEHPRNKEWPLQVEQSMGKLYTKVLKTFQQAHKN